MGLGVVRSGVPEQAVNPARRRLLSQDGRLQIDRQQGIASLACGGGEDTGEVGKGDRRISEGEQWVYRVGQERNSQKART